MPAADKEILTIEPWAAAIALGTVLLVSCVAAFTAWDRMHTPELETVITPTAVGDTHFIHEPPGGKGPIGLKFQGAQLDMLSEDKVRDSKLIRAASDDSGVYSLYRPVNDRDLPKGHYYLKAAINDFIEVAPE